MSKISSLITVICILAVIAVPSHGCELNLTGGIIAVVLSPFDDCGNLNLSVVPQMAKYYADNNITNIFLTELNGDGTLPLRERKELIAAWVEHGCPLGLNFVVEIGLLPFVDTLSLASYCSKLNVAAITHFPELVYKAKNLGEVIEDLKKISEAAPNLPLIYNELLLANSDVSADAVFLAGDEVPTFCGVETTPDSYWDIEAVTSKGNKEVWIFDVIARPFSLQHYMYAAFIFGLKSASIGPNIAPRLCIEIEAAANRCDRENGKALQKKMNSLIAAFGNLNGGVIDDEDSRTFYTNLRAAYEIITGIKVGARYPVKKANSTVYNQIASRFKSLGVNLADSGSQYSV